MCVSLVKLWPQNPSNYYNFMVIKTVNGSVKNLTFENLTGAWRKKKFPLSLVRDI